jgi:hypothetical protein
MMMVESSRTVTVMSRDDQARVQLLRVLRRSGLTREELHDLVDVAFRRRIRRGVRRRSHRPGPLDE